MIGEEAVVVNIVCLKVLDVLRALLLCICTFASYEEGEGGDNSLSNAAT